eukprot:m.138161 g.138161  ORF g.138161 m.138161 type:complete len:194 (+) comp13462_c0_seq1:83-664(+)
MFVLSSVVTRVGCGVVRSRATAAVVSKCSARFASSLCFGSQVTFPTLSCANHISMVASPLGTFNHIAHMSTLKEEPAFAVVHFGGKQHKVTNNDIVIINKLECDVGRQIRLEKVLMAGDRNKTLIGTPLLSRDEVFVSALVVEHSLGENVIAFKKKRRQGYARRKDHQQHLTTLRITNVDILDAASDHEAAVE